jgi:hypothetical protein
MKRLVLPAVLALIPASRAQERVVFEGLPIKKVESSFAATGARDLTPEEAFQYQVRIVERNGRFYWASRGMKELVRSESVLHHLSR